MTDKSVSGGASEEARLADVGSVLIRLAMLSGPFKSDEDIEIINWLANRELSRRATPLTAKKESQLTDTARLDWLDSLGRFVVGLNPHDGRQTTEGDIGQTTILRLWHKQRGGENQSLREAIDKIRPTKGTAEK